MTDAIWVNGKRTVKGRWDYHWPSDAFIIFLKQKDRTTGQDTKRIVTYNDTPEWGNWKLVKPQEEPKP